MNYYTVALEAHMLSNSKDIKFKDAWASAYVTISAGMAPVRKQRKML